MIDFRTFSKMAAKVHCESSHQLGFALSYTPPPLVPSNGEKTVFMVTSNVYFDCAIESTGHRHVPVCLPPGKQHPITIKQ